MAIKVIYLLLVAMHLKISVTTDRDKTKLLINHGGTFDITVYCFQANSIKSRRPN